MICFFSLFSFYYLVSSMIVGKQRTGEIVSGFFFFFFPSVLCSFRFPTIISCTIPHPRNQKD